MKWIQFLLLIIPIHLVSGQHLKDAELMSLVKAEESFSRMAKEKSARDAFLFFLMDDAITFVPAQGPRKGKVYLEKQQPDSSWLHWWPVFTDIAASGDFGYNTGPWEFRQKRTDKEPVAYGEFISLWKKNPQGEWRVALDVGIRHQKPVTARPLTSSAIRSEKKGGLSGEQPGQFDPEQEFIRSLMQRGSNAYIPLLSEEAKFFRPGYEPFYGKETVQDFLNHSREKVTCDYVSGEISPSHDLACVYGTASRESIEDGVTKTVRHSYVRFWKREHGQWKIVLDVLSD